jgi:hypothetical protein
MCALLSTLHDLCVLSDKCPKRECWAKTHHWRSLWLDDGFDGPRPLDRAKPLIHSRRENGLWPVPARDTDRPHGADVGFLSNIVVSSAQRSDDDGSIALLAWKSRQMEIMRCGFQRADECSIPGHGRHRPVVNNGILAQLGDLGHRALLLYAAICHPFWAGMAGRRAARWRRRRFETPFDEQYGSRRHINLTPIAHMDRISRWTICSIVDSNFPDKMPSFYVRSSNRSQRVNHGS